MFDTLIVFLKEFFGKVNFENSQQTTINIMKNYPAGRVNIYSNSCVSSHKLKGTLLQPCNYQLSKSIVREIKFGDIAVMLI